MVEKKNEWLASLKYFMRFTFEDKKFGLFVFLFSLILPFANLAFPLTFRKFIDTLIYEPRVSSIIYWLLILFIVYLLTYIFGGLLNLFTERYKQKITIKLREKFMDHFLKLELGYYSSKGSGYFLQRAQEALQLRDLMVDSFAGLIANSVLFIVINIVVFRINFWIGVVFLSAMSSLVWSTFFPQREIRCRSTTLKETEAQLTEEAQVVLNNIEKIKANSWESYIIKKFIERSKTVFSKAMKLIKWQIGWQTFGAIIPIPFYLTAFALCSILIVKREMTIGMLIAINQLASMLLQSGLDVIKTYTQIQISLPACIRVFTILKSEPLIKDGFMEPSLVTAKQDLKPELVGDKIFFRYPNQVDYIFKDLSFKIKYGEWVCIAGKNGSGKSTLFKLILRLYDPEKGSICINRHNIKKYKLSYLRKILLYVPQEPFLFPGTVIENLKVVAPEKDDKEIKSYLMNLGFDDFIVSLPKGLQTPVNADGRGLSGGQKQVVGLLRVFLRDADILLLDEPTAAIDPFFEIIFEETLFRHKRKKTVLVNAHKPKTLQWADRILVLDGGRIQAIGKHIELLERNKIYQAYFNKLLLQERQ